MIRRNLVQRYKGLLGLVLGASCGGTLAACSADAPADAEPIAAPASSADPAAQTPDAPTATTPATPAGIPIVAARSLVITAASVIEPCLQAQGLSTCGVDGESTFSLRRTLGAILSTGGAAGGDVASDLARRIWDTDNATATASFDDGAHCDDQKDASGTATRNGFPIQCARPEGAMAASGTDLLSPTSTSYFYPIALVSRLDLRDSTTCGEFRILYGRVDANGPAPGGRALLNFEGVLPNPRPELGEAGCGPIATLWAGFSDTTTTAESVRNALSTFYFSGTDLTYPDGKTAKTMPVVHFDNLGGKRGQLRTNEFMNTPGTLPRWLLRELKASKTAGGAIELAPDYVKKNPWPGLFSQATGGDAFSTWFTDQVPGLAASTVTAITIADDARFGAGQSDAETGPTGAEVVGPTGDATRFSNDYARFASVPLTSAVQAKLTAVGSTLTPRNIFDRATAVSCGGCHRHSNGDSLGGGLSWPTAAGFTHVDETPQVARPNDAFGTTGSSFAISPALDQVFLPARATDLAALLSKSSR